ncbi:MAG: aminotransferase class I/II-fold pyridoxal phosphate-dependent enzyme [Candidatus Electrothrix scaldis]|nr:MAG: aminotransferase class I/II-fold pyridoxal phosphate-dependent enzyme [Candidatus Electrothrix sp. GW3-3]
MPNEKMLSEHINSCNTPIYQTATYVFKDTEQVIQYHKGEVELGRYGRYSNPNWTEAEEHLARLDDAEEALLFSTGMNAIVTAMLTFIRSGDNIIFTGNCYRNTRTFFTSMLSDMGVTAYPVSSADPEQFDEVFLKQYRVLQPKIIFVEAPCNPHLYLVDIKKIRSIIHSDTLLVVDSTMSSPYNFKPLYFGADLVIHSCTKYLSGHGDIMAGSIAGSKELIRQVRAYRGVVGGIADPRCAALLNRSLKTFGLRMKHYNQAGMKLARYLEDSPYVDRVFYTGLESHPHADLAKKQLKGHGGVLSFDIKGDSQETARFVDTVQLPFMGSNFGTDTTLIEQCSVFTYYHYTGDERRELDISDSLIRLSLGYENVDLIIDDIETSFIKALPHIKQ